MKSIYTKFMYLAILMGFSFVANSQRTISGMISDAATGEGLIGANVVVKGGSVGTITDFDGRYELNVPAGSDMLVFSYAGYSDQEIQIGSSNVVNVSMTAGSILDELVIVGYGTQKKSDLTGSVASLKSKDFNQGVITSADQLLQSRVPGVSVINNSGQPGGEATVKIRGNNSIRAGANPLYVVDGVPLDGRTARAALLSSDLGNIANSNPLNFLNPTDIASIEVLKDASSAAIYGSRASNGVILITTKKAQNGEPSVDFGASFGTSSLLKNYDVLTGDEYRQALTDYGLTEGNGGDNVDAMDAILRNGSMQNYNLSVGTGGPNSNIRFSAGYQDVQGIVRESGLKRYTAMLNGNFKVLNDKAGIDVLLLGSQSNESIAPISTNPGFTGNLIGQALQWNPTIPLVDTNGNFVTGKNNPTSATVGETTINPLQLLAAHNEDAKTTTVLASISPYYNITKNLTYRYRFGVNYGIGNTRGNISGNVNVQNIEGLGFSAIANNELLTNLHSHTLNFDTDLTSNVTMNLLGGFEYQKFDFKGFALAGRGFTVQDFDNTNAIQNGATSNRLIQSFADPISELQSYFGRANFGINNKYFVTATLRADGSTKFGENNRYGIFPSIGVAWNVTNENFMADSGLFDDLKVRVGWGQTGNQEFPAGSALERYQLLPNGGSKLENAFNPDLQWESSTTTNVGIDYSILNYRLSGSIDYYTRNTNNLLLDPQVSEPGPDLRPFKNIEPEVINSGLELGLNAFLVNKTDLNVTLGGNIAFLQNEFVSEEGEILAGDLFGQGSTGAFVQRMADGYPLNTFFVKEFTGLDADGNNTFTTVDGEEVLVAAGDPNADIILGLSLGLSAKKLSFGANFNGAFGHQLYNNTAMSVIPIGNLGNRNIDSSLLGNEVEESLSNAITSSSRYIENGDFLKLSNATLGYNLGDVAGFKNIGISLTGQNLFVITNYSGFDPEINTVNLRNGVPSSGIEYIPYPTARSIVFGINASF